MTEPDRRALNALCAVARWCYGASAVSVAVVDGDGLLYVAADGETGDAIVGTRLALGTGIAGFVAATGQSIVVRDLERDPRFARDVAERTGYVPSTIQCIPFHDDERDGDVAGVISLLDRAEAEPVSNTSGAPSVEWFTALAAHLCSDTADSRAEIARFSQLPSADRERAMAVLTTLLATLDQ